MARGGWGMDEHPLSEAELEHLLNSYTDQATPAKTRRQESRQTGAAADVDCGAPQGGEPGDDERETTDDESSKDIAETVGEERSQMAGESAGGASGAASPEESEEVTAKGPPPGTIEISDGRVVVHASASNGAPPTIGPGRNVLVLVNGEIVTSKTRVGPDDVVEVTPDTREPSVDLEVALSDDRLKAYLNVVKTKGVHVAVVDIPPQSSLTPRGRIVDRPEPADPDEEEILAVLEAEGVTYGIDAVVVKEIAAGKRRGRQVVARGIAPQPGVDGWIDFKFEREEQVPAVDPETGRVDFLAREELPSAEVGDVVAVRHPPREGKAGRSVLGDVLPAPSPKDVKLQAREGTEIASDGETVVATQAGRPLRKGEQLFVLKEYNVNGNVDLHTGNITFKGDVVVSGDVEERLQVQASGRIAVRGSVVRARLVAECGIKVHGQLIGAKVYAGAFAYSRLEEMLSSVARELRGLTGAVEQLRSTFKERSSFVPPDDQLTLFLLQRKFASLPKKIEDLDTFVRELSVPMEVDVRPALKRLGRHFEPARRVRLHGVEEIAELIAELDGLAGACRDIEAIPVHIVGGAANQAVIRASGDLFLLGKGAYQSDVVIGGGAVVSGSFRGGKLETRAGVYVGELGSLGGVKTSVATAANGWIHALRIHPGVRVKVGGATWDCIVPRDRTTFRLDQDGRLELADLDTWNPPQPPDI